MNQLKNTIWNRRLPSFMGLFFLVFAFGTITWLSRNAILFGTKAAVDEVPKNVTISNISDTSFTVFYVTSDSVLGTINFGKDTTTDQIAFDTRDKSQGIAQPHRAHYITLQGLEPATKYFFTITSGSKNFSNETVPYEVTTATALTAAQSTNETLTGKVTLSDGSLPSEAIASVSSPDSQVASTLVETDGAYSINLQTVRNKNLTALAALTPNTILKLQIIDPTMQSNVSLLTSQSNPVPIIILSKDYDFAISDTPLSPSPVASGSGEVVTFPEVEEAGDSSPQILTPKDEQGFKDQQPLFKGKAVPNGEVEITIHSDEEITTTISADANGSWQYRPTTPLSPGEHTITIRTLDADGIIRTITQSFVVYAQGSEFTQPSVSPVPSTTTTPTAKPTATATPKPTNTPSPTKATTTVSPTTTTATPTITTAVTISPTAPPVPVTGNTALTITIISIISVVSIGALLFFFTAV